MQELGEILGWFGYLWHPAVSLGFAMNPKLVKQAWIGWMVAYMAKLGHGIINESPEIVAGQISLMGIASLAIYNIFNSKEKNKMKEFAQDFTPHIMTLEDYRPLIEAGKMTEDEVLDLIKFQDEVRTAADSKEINSFFKEKHI
jgi:hypothetical protein